MAKFEKGHVKTGGKTKGTKHNVTIIKEAVGLSSWEKLQDFMLNKGLDKFIDEISNMKGAAYSINYLQMVEYFKPKLARVDSNVNIKGEMKHFMLELSDELEKENDKENDK